ncbi:hypothetical protein GFB49_00905 [Epibacterium sp. SM1979]|uniref:Uncharacterized protein n=1 Tax=Tritonibacter litoralis TaxID=2662264 RepID=A0A843YC03_9RHOB|nr:hypothetical protein [Tritonibacter litoralis]MQQ07004.1 hypothetical protein [Tritonibacter litoralis]
MIQACEEVITEIEREIERVKEVTRKQVENTFNEDVTETIWRDPRSITALAALSIQKERFTS